MMPDYKTPTVKKLSALLDAGVTGDKRSEPAAYAIALAADMLAGVLKEKSKASLPAGDVEADDMLLSAWGLISNAWDGDWGLANPDWKEAAERWRDCWHERIGRQKASLPAEGVDEPEDEIWTRAIHAHSDPFNDAVQVVWEDDDGHQHTEMVPVRMWEHDFGRIEGTIKKWQRAEWEKCLAEKKR